jgi:DNA-binding response OmpR family regulator
MVILVIAGTEKKERIAAALGDTWQLRQVDEDNLHEEERLTGDLAVISLDHDDTETGREIKRLMRHLRENTPVLAILPPRYAWDYSAPPLFDDFVYQDFQPEEMKARVWQLLFHHQLITTENILQVRDLLFDFDRYEARFKGHPLELTFKEYELLRFLAARPGKVFTREILLEQVWGYDYYGGSRTVDVHIRRIRSKIDSPEHNYINTVRGAGYIFEP